MLFALPYGHIAGIGGYDDGWHGVGRGIVVVAAALVVVEGDGGCLALYNSAGGAAAGYALRIAIRILGHGVCVPCGNTGYALFLIVLQRECRHSISESHTTICNFTILGIIILRHRHRKGKLLVVARAAAGNRLLYGKAAGVVLHLGVGVGDGSGSNSLNGIRCC